MSPIVPTIILAILIIGLVLFIKNKQLVPEQQSPKEEPFADSNAIPNVTFCPSGSTATILQSGQTHCCKGPVSKKFGCLEETVCTLSGSADGKIPTCGQVMKRRYDEQAKKHCFPGMPNYYEKADEAGNVIDRGCYSGPSNIDMTGPANTKQPQCVINYSNEAQAAADPKSCSNYKRLEAKQCPKGIKCNKSFMETGKGSPLLLQVGWMGKRQMFGKEMDAPVTTYTISSIVNYWNKVWPEWSKSLNWGSLNAAQLGEFIYEVRRDLLQGARAPQQTGIFWEYIDFYILKGAKNLY